jgi:anti-sigma B factor antagonist
MQAVGETKQDTARGSVTFLIGRREISHETTVLSVEGDLDLSSAPELKWALANVQSDGPHNVVVDLGRVAFIDSTALGVLVGAQRMLDTSLQLVIVCADQNVMRIFEMTGLDGMFELVPTLDAALEHIRGSATAAG